MDDLLVQRFKSGDPAAATGMRNQLRAMAARVLGAPQWEIDASHRQTLEREAAAEAMDSEAKDAVQFVVGTMLAAGKRGITWLRKRDGLKEEDHPSRAVMAGVALQTASANQKLQLQKHFEECHTCKLHFDIAEEAIRGAANAQRAAQAASPAPPPKAPDQDLADYARQRARQAAPVPSQTRKEAEQERKKAARKRRLKRKPTGGSLVPVVLVFAAVAAGLWWKQQPTEEQRIWMVSALLPDERPPLGRIASYDGTTATAIRQAAGEGNCRSAGNKLRNAWDADKGDWWLRYYEGMAFVCARDGHRATEALEYVDDNTTDLPWGFTWWLGQAYLLDLRIDEGLAVLDSLGASKHPRAADARELAARVRDTM